MLKIKITAYRKCSAARNKSIHNIAVGLKANRVNRIAAIEVPATIAVDDTVVRSTEMYNRIDRAVIKLNFCLPWLLKAQPSECLIRVDWVRERNERGHSTTVFAFVAVTVPAPSVGRLDVQGGTKVC